MSRVEEFAKGQEIKVLPSGREAEIAEQNTGNANLATKAFCAKWECLQPALP